MRKNAGNHIPGGGRSDVWPLPPRVLYDKILAAVELKIRGVNDKKYGLQPTLTNPISREGRNRTGERFTGRD